jgi:hypothetical protein
MALGPGNVLSLTQTANRMSASVLRAWRKWLVRATVFGLVAATACVGVLYQRWTNPAAVRRQVMDHLAAQFLHTRVSLESAHLRLVDGIAVTDLRLARSDDRDKNEYLYVPSAIIYHDKEQLLNGKLSIRKVELFQPTLRIVRGADGHWNLAGILAPSEPNEPLPTLVIHQGTIELEDHQGTTTAPPLKLKDVNLTVINDPLPTLTFEGSAQADVAGAIHFKGARDRPSEQTTLTVRAPHVPVDPALIERVSAYYPQVAVHTRELRGNLAIDADLGYYPSSATDFRYEVRAHLTQGSFSHAQLPLPLQQLEATLQCVNGKVPVAKLSARSGQAELSLTVKDLTPSESHSLESWVRELDFQARHLSVTPALFKPLPDDLQDISEDYSPSGLASVNFTIDRTPKGEPHKHCLFTAEDMQASFVKFPYRVEHIAGTIDADLTPGRDDLIKLDFHGMAGRQPVFLRGELVGDKPSGVNVVIWGKGLPLDRKILDALPDKYKTLAESFHASGLGDFTAYIRRDHNSCEYANRFVITFHDARACYDVFPYPLENVGGVLDIQPNQWEFRGFRGSHHDGVFNISGRCYPLKNGGDHLEVNLRGTNALLDAEMQKALGPYPELVKTWHEFKPTGRIDFEGKVDRLTGKTPDIDLTVLARGCSIQPTFFNYRLDDLRGKIHYGQRWVELGQVQARHGNAVVTLGNGIIHLNEGGGFYADLRQLEGKPLVPDAEFLRALPEKLQTCCEALQIKGPIALSTRLVIAAGAEPGPPTIYWDGWADLHDISLTTGIELEHVSGQVACRGRHDGQRLESAVGNFILTEATVFKNQPFHNVHGRIEVTPDAPEVIKLPGFYANYFGGAIYGPVRVEFGPTVRYELKLTASGVQLEEFARHNNFGSDVQMSGLASASLYLRGEGADLNNLKGGGTINVPDGKMCNLPPLLPLLKVVGLRPPDRTAFEEAKADFEINGTRVHVNQVDLFGNAISLRGQGEMNLNGTDINLDFNVDWARVPQMLPAGIKQIPHAISDQLLKIKMRGQLGDLHCTKEPVPMLLDPFKKLWHGWRKDEDREQAAGREPQPEMRTTQYVSPRP